MNGKYIAIIILLALLVLFLVLNSAQITVNFIFFKVVTSTAILILISAVIGFLIGTVLINSMKKQTKKANGKI